MRAAPNILRHLIGLLVLLLCSSTVAAAQERGQSRATSARPSMESPKILATVVRRSGGETRALTLWSQEIRELTGSDLLRYFAAHPERTSFPNTAYIVVDSAYTDLSKGRIVWVDYVYRDLTIRPQQIWSPGIVLSASGQDAYVVLVKSIGWQVNLMIYKTDFDKEIASFPIELDPLKSSDWLRFAQPISQLNKTLVGKNVTGISKIDVVAQREHLLIFGERDDKDSAPVCFRFDLDTKQWAELAWQQLPPSAPR
jgi:hypothetical protein